MEADCFVDDDQVVVCNVIERKWVMIAKLQRQNMNLTKEIKELNKRLEEMIPGKKTTDMGDAVALPRSPAFLTLAGHRDIITSVSIHPVYSLIASGSADGSTKIWDN
jgi:platelet-activating factor acetylhydrolase IB subunit alpha